MHPHNNALLWLALVCLAASTVLGAPLLSRESDHDDQDNDDMNNDETAVALINDNNDEQDSNNLENTNSESEVLDRLEFLSNALAENQLHKEEERELEELAEKQMEQAIDEGQEDEEELVPVLVDEETGRMFVVVDEPESDMEDDNESIDLSSLPYVPEDGDDDSAESEVIYPSVEEMLPESDLADDEVYFAKRDDEYPEVFVVPSDWLDTDQLPRDPKKPSSPRDLVDGDNGSNADDTSATTTSTTTEATTTTTTTEATTTTTASDEDSWFDKRGQPEEVEWAKQD